MAGRPTKISQERINTIIDSIARGEPVEVAAALAGIAKSTLYRWLDIGDAELESGEGDIDPDDYLKRQLVAIAKDRNIDLTGATTKAQIAERINAEPSLFSDFSDRYKKAQAQAESFVVNRMVNTGQDDWRFWMTFAERRWPQRWARRNRLEEEIEDYETIGSGTADEASAMLERGKEIRVKMLGTGTD